MQLPSSVSFEPSLVPIMRKVGASPATSCGLLRFPPSWLTSSSTYILPLPGSDQMQTLTRTWIIPMDQNRHGEEGLAWGGALGDSLQVSWELPFKDVKEGR